MEDIYSSLHCHTYTHTFRRAQGVSIAWEALPADEWLNHTEQSIKVPSFTMNVVWLSRDDAGFNNENTNIREGIATGMKHCGKFIETTCFQG